MQIIIFIGIKINKKLYFPGISLGFNFKVLLWGWHHTLKCMSATIHEMHRLEHILTPQCSTPWQSNWAVTSSGVAIASCFYFATNASFFYFVPTLLDENYIFLLLSHNSHRCSFRYKFMYEFIYFIDILPCTNFLEPYLHSFIS